MNEAPSKAAIARWRDCGSDGEDEDEGSIGEW
jgi:hypothetical protein